MGLLELSDLTFCFLASNSVTLLDFSDELIPLTLDNLPVIVGQATPLLLVFPDELLPFIWSLFIVGISVQLTLTCQQRRNVSGSVAPLHGHPTSIALGPPRLSS